MLYSKQYNCAKDDYAMKRLVLLIPVIFIFSCSTIFPPSRDVRPYRAPETRRPPKPKTVEPAVGNVFNASFNEVWSATLDGLKWMKWAPAFTDELEGTIRLKEAYVYRNSGKLLRIYNWPPSQETAQSNIDDYLLKVSDYNLGFNLGRPVFTQESMMVRLGGFSESKVKVDIDYEIRPYFTSVGFTDAVKSSGYIESLLLERIKENLSGRPQARR
jgi:hypothetical protein